MKSECEYEFSTSFPVSPSCLHSVVYGPAAVCAVSGVSIYVVCQEQRVCSVFTQDHRNMVWKSNKNFLFTEISNSFTQEEATLQIPEYYAKAPSRCYQPVSICCFQHSW